MKHALLILTLSLATPAMAEEDTGGLSLMERGAQMLMEGLLREMEPALDDLQGMAQNIGPALQDFAAHMGPALRDLLNEVEDWSVYHPPEILENGDIIIRRKPQAEPEQTPDAQIDI
ncbi:hypothetical protein [uncultured Tateyamaria sp.]|uniref:hypothetical protein n=1 Tax=Tateyamaria sp. 1078 TaxID=3417464 RepID=UPI002611F506|nr:hypothetical protein [uncultured Tateyamaria sp.]